jgi:predicted AAA+ superfamily ATPase
VAAKIGQLAQELSRINPWWRDPKWRDLDPDLLDARADGLSFRSGVLDGLVPGGLYILRGPRRVGKTVAIKQTIEDLLDKGIPPTCIVRVAADGWAAKDIRTLAQRTALPTIPEGQIRYWFIDEVSAVSGAWDQQIKWLRDNDNEFRASTVVLTGSNASSLMEAAGALAGRRGNAPNLDRTLLPMGFATFVRLVGRQPVPTRPAVSVSELRTDAAIHAYADLLPWLDYLVELWEMYTQYGGFPRAVAAARKGQPVPLGFVEDLFGVISADTFKASRLSANTEMVLLERLWMSMSSPANLSSIGAAIDTTHQVIARHIDYLRDAFLLWSCPQRAESKWIPRERAQDKLYAVDPLVARLAHLRNSSRQDIDPTVMTEMQIGMALRRRMTADRGSAMSDEFLFYVRTPTRKEIDFVSEYLVGTAIEGKYCEDGGWNSEAATVNASEWNGILVTRNVLDTSSQDAWAIPAGLLCYLLDT